MNDQQAMDQLCINTIRCLTMDAIEQAKSGHPGLPLGAASMAYVLWTRFLRHNPNSPHWWDRDRFVLSAGHGSMLLYSLLHLCGYPLSLEEIRSFRQQGSRTPGHPEFGLTPGVETTTGPLGQGFGNAVGFAMAEAHLAARFNRPGHSIVDHFTYVLAGDGDLMEGVAAEAASLAGHLGLGKLICLYDDNRISLAGSTDLGFTEDVALRFEAYGWQTLRVEDGNDLDAIDRAIQNAQLDGGRPTLILVRTQIGFGAPHKQGRFEAHGSPLGEEEVRLAKKQMGWPEAPAFLVPAEATDHFKNVQIRGQRFEQDWRNRWVDYQKVHPGLAQELESQMQGNLTPGYDRDVPRFAPDAKGVSTRAASGKVLRALAANCPSLLGGSADLNPSTLTTLPGLGDFGNPNRPLADPQGAVGNSLGFEGRNIHFGVREHAMGAIANGLCLHQGLRPYTATFLVFSDYMRPPMRLAALMKTPVIFVFTHDSIGVGEDGPTHQPVEQLATLRAIPGLTVLRPCDANETSVAWKVALESRDRPTAIILSRQDLPVLDRERFGSAEGLRRGAYVLEDDPTGPFEMILIATGSEVPLIVAAADQLRSRKIRVRLVSMPSFELFEGQPADYRAEVLPPSVNARVSVEAGVTQGWRAYTGDKGLTIGLDRFGASAPGPVLMRHFGFDAQKVCSRILQWMDRV